MVMMTDVDVTWLPEPRKLVSEIRNVAQRQPLRVGPTDYVVSIDFDELVLEPGCIAGVALHSMGHTIEQICDLWDYLDACYGPDASDRESVEWIVAVQLAHDAGKPYSQCVRDADRKIEYQAYEGDF